MTCQKYRTEVWEEPETDQVSQELDRHLSECRHCRTWLDNNIKMDESDPLLQAIKVLRLRDRFKMNNPIWS
jgi:hypothetical protein